MACMSLMGPVYGYSTHQVSGIFLLVFPMSDYKRILLEHCFEYTPSCNNVIQKWKKE